MSLLPKIFEDACAEAHSRYAKMSPFVKGGQLYSTDGVIIVRTQNLEWLELPPVADIPWGEKKKEQLPLYHFRDEVPKRIKCDKCDGARKSKCQECNGEGERECSMDHYHACDDCDGSGMADCGKCYGEGTTKPEYRVVQLADDIYLSEEYVRMYQAANATAWTIEGKSGMLRIIGKEWDGLIMRRMPADGGDVVLDARVKPETEATPKGAQTNA